MEEIYRWNGKKRNEKRKMRKVGKRMERLRLKRNGWKRYGRNKKLK